MRGAAANPAAPSDILLRLLDPGGRAAWTVLCEERDLPAVVVEAVIGHPERVVRRAFARNPFADPAQRGRLVDDPDCLVRVSLAGGPRRRRARPTPLPDEVVEKFLLAEGNGGDELLTGAEIAQELVSSRQIRQGFQQVALQHPDPRLRAWAAGHWLVLSPRQRDAIRADPDPDVRAEAQRQSRYADPEAMAAELPERDCHYRSMLLVNYAVSRKVAEECLATGRDLWALAHNPHTPADIVARLARVPDPEVRACVAARSDLGPSLLAELADDPVGVVRTRALVHPLPRTDAQRVAIDRIFGLCADEIGQVGGITAERDTDWYEACATSAHPLLRRIAATHPELSAGLMNKLAGDPDAEVRHLLAFNHPLAPAGLLLEAFLACPGQRRLLLTLPRLPRVGLAGLADHDDPEVRALAAADPTLGDPLDALLADSELDVRRAAAANPQLPPALLTALLADPELAEAAATNPRLSPEQLHELLDQAGLPPLRDGRPDM